MNAAIPHTSEPALSGDRFGVEYRIVGCEAAAKARALGICLEQSVELPDAVVPPGVIKNEIVGRLEWLRNMGENVFLARISYAVEVAGGELTQLLNVIFGNSSLQPGIRVERLVLDPHSFPGFSGPRFGRGGLRDYLGIRDGPILCAALKPMGLSSKDLAELAYRFALGGIDLIKDDHGLADQPFSRFEERLDLCTKAVAKANRETGQRCFYVPNVTAESQECFRRSKCAKEAGAGALLISPGLTGFETMKLIGENDSVSLPMLSHPAFQGAFVTSPSNGISHYALFGQIVRLAGADASIFPNYGGRFSFSRADCRRIADGCSEPMSSLKPIFPAPGGGMSLENLPEIKKFYGNDFIALVGGGLFKHGADLVEACRIFKARTSI